MRSKFEQEFHFDEDENLNSTKNSMEKKIEIKEENNNQKEKEKKTEKDKETRKRKRSPLRKRIEELEELVSLYEKEIKEINDKNLRLHAEFDNFRKRQERELERALKYAGEDIILDLVSIVDDLERTLKALETETTDNVDSTTAIKKGIELIYNKIQKTLEKWDVHPIEAVGKPFDPDLHEAMMMKETDDNVEPNTVIEEFEKGYTFKDKVLRHSKVVVSV